MFGAKINPSRSSNSLLSYYFPRFLFSSPKTYNSFPFPLVAFLNHCLLCKPPLNYHYTTYGIEWAKIISAIALSFLALAFWRYIFRRKFKLLYQNKI